MPPVDRRDRGSRRSLTDNGDLGEVPRTPRDGLRRRGRGFVDATSYRLRRRMMTPPRPATRSDRPPTGVPPSAAARSRRPDRHRRPSRAAVLPARPGAAAAAAEPPPPPPALPALPPAPPSGVQVFVKIVHAAEVFFVLQAPERAAAVRRQVLVRPAASCRARAVDDAARVVVRRHLVAEADAVAGLAQAARRPRRRVLAVRVAVAHAAALAATDRSALSMQVGLFVPAGSGMQVPVLSQVPQWLQSVLQQTPTVAAQRDRAVAAQALRVAAAGVAERELRRAASTSSRRRRSRRRRTRPRSSAGSRSRDRCGSRSCTARRRWRRGSSRNPCSPTWSMTPDSCRRRRTSPPFVIWPRSVWQPACRHDLPAGA